MCTCVTRSISDEIAYEKGVNTITDPIQVAAYHAGPWEKEWGWGLHHVNLQAGDVRKVVDFFCLIAECHEGQWQAPSKKGDFSIDPEALSILPLGSLNRGLHIIRPDAGFAHR